MGFLVIMPFAVLAGWSVYRIHRWLFHGEFGPEWRRRFVILALIGVGVGTWLAFFSAYNVANKHLEGFPIPTAISSREKPTDPWVRYALPMVMRSAGMVTNVLCGIALSLVPLALMAFIKENKGQKVFAGPRG